MPHIRGKLNHWGKYEQFLFQINKYMNTDGDKKSLLMHYSIAKSYFVASGSFIHLQFTKISNIYFKTV